MANLKPHQRALLYAGIASLVLSAIPVIRLLLLPVQYLNTHLHEFCHAMMAQISGGDASHILVFSNGSGVTPVQTSSWIGILLVASAGYIGASLIGVGTILMSRTEASARTVLRILAAGLGISMLIWVRGDLVGIVSGLAWIAVLLLAANGLKGPNLLFAAQFVGVQQCLNSMESVYTLFKITAVSEQASDAMIMQQNTGLPAIFWSALWCLVSLALLYTGIRRAWTDRVPN